VDAGCNNEVAEDVGRVLTRSVKYVDDIYVLTPGVEFNLLLVDIRILERRTACKIKCN
jgi:hypothetical protein